MIAIDIGAVLWRRESERRGRMGTTRREVLKTGGGVTLMALLAATGWLVPGRGHAQTWSKAAFDAKSVDEAEKALGGGPVTPSKDIAFVSTPDIAENGAVVPVGIASALPNTESIAILIEKNPTLLAAVFDLPPGTDSAISTRVKMAQTSNVYALVKADGKYYVASKEIKVTIGGCGG